MELENIVETNKQYIQKLNSIKNGIQQFQQNFRKKALAKEGREKPFRQSKQQKQWRAERESKKEHHFGNEYGVTSSLLKQIATEHDLSDAGQVRHLKSESSDITSNYSSVSQMNNLLNMAEPPQMKQKPVSHHLVQQIDSLLSRVDSHSKGISSKPKLSKLEKPAVLQGQKRLSEGQKRPKYETLGATKDRKGKQTEKTQKLPRQKDVFERGYQISTSFDEVPLSINDLPSASSKNSAESNWNNGAWQINASKPNGQFENATEDNSVSRQKLKIRESIGKRKQIQAKLPPWPDKEEIDFQLSDDESFMRSVSEDNASMMSNYQEREIIRELNFLKQIASNLEAELQSVEAELSRIQNED